MIVERCIVYDCMQSVLLDDAQSTCCSDAECAGFSYDADTKSGCYKRNSDCGMTVDVKYNGYFKPSFTPPHGQPIDIELDFSLIGLSGQVRVYDIWSHRSEGVFNGRYVAKQVPFHGTSFLILTQT